ncbi:hypothetical protein NECAME_08884 [Necator americanus]|uniref:Uncharacterized protein n=1 Tax=Necator americanus TaxID=51031 RepID=W2TIG9_NECAM|nr:hypothetical protein NECAME_08884 [Necator americanus]ETN80807.1 hypothetical protein NECAME_08884 [Necator americanus]
MGRFSACLMLDHPTLGVHYTCHSKLQKDGFCREKTSKSGAVVRICGCNSDDFCNYSYWPDKSALASPLPQRQPVEERIRVENGAKLTILSNTFIFFLLVLSL